MDSILKKNGDYWCLLYNCSKAILVKNRKNEKKYGLYITLCNMNIKKSEIMQELNKKMNNISHIISENAEIKLLYTLICELANKSFSELNETYVNKQYKYIISILNKIFNNKSSLYKLEDIVSNLYYYIVELFIDNKEKIGKEIFENKYDLIISKYIEFRPKLDDYIITIFSSYKTDKCKYVKYKLLFNENFSKINIFFVENNYAIDNLNIVCTVKDKNVDYKNIIDFILKNVESVFDDLEKIFSSVKSEDSPQIDITRFLNENTKHFANDILSIIPKDIEEIAMCVLAYFDCVTEKEHPIILKCILLHLYVKQLTKSFLKQFSIFGLLDMREINEELKKELHIKRNIYEIISNYEYVVKAKEYLQKDEYKHIFNYEDFCNSTEPVYKYLIANINVKTIFELVMKSMFGDDNEIVSNFDPSKLSKDDITNVMDKFKNFKF
jgi:hypothetical protein